MPRDDRFKKYQEAGRGLSGDGSDPGRGIPRRSSPRLGDSTQKQAQDAFEEMVEGSRRGTEQIVNTIRAEIASQLSVIGIATRKEIEQLERRLTALENAGPASTTGAVGPARKAGRPKKAAPPPRRAASREGQRRQPKGGRPEDAGPERPAKKSRPQEPAQKAAAKKAPAKKATAKRLFPSEGRPGQAAGEEGDGRGLSPRRRLDAELVRRRLGRQPQSGRRADRGGPGAGRGSGRGSSRPAGRARPSRSSSRGHRRGSSAGGARSSTPPSIASPSTWAARWRSTPEPLRAASPTASCSGARPPWSRSTWAEGSSTTGSAGTRRVNVTRKDQCPHGLTGRSRRRAVRHRGRRPVVHLAAQRGRPPGRLDRPGG